MRFLVDENLSPRVCDHLARAGHEAVHVRDAGLRSAPDPQVLARAGADGRILLTADRGDFGRELARTQALAPSVVLLRQLPDVVRAEQVAAVCWPTSLPHSLRRWTRERSSSLLRMWCVFGICRFAEGRAEEPVLNRRVVRRQALIYSRRRSSASTTSTTACMARTLAPGSAALADP